MSERITWQPYPRCGAPAAVGWAPADQAPLHPARQPPPETRAVEFDCTRGCTLSATQLRSLPTPDEE